MKIHQSSLNSIFFRIIQKISKNQQEALYNQKHLQLIE